MSLRPNSDEFKRKVNLPAKLDRIVNLTAEITEVYLFGSRRHCSGSIRSDVDLLIRTRDDAALSFAWIQDVWKVEPYLDVFHAVGGEATSKVNESRIRCANEDALVSRLDAVLIWRGGQWVGDEKFAEQTVLRYNRPVFSFGELYRLKDPLEESFDVCVIAALAEEYRALVDVFQPDSGQRSDNLHANHAEVTIGGVNGDIRVWLACVNRMGPVDAALFSLRNLELSGARLVVLAGIAAGLRGKIRLGQVVVPFQVANYELAKIHGNGQALRPTGSVLITPRMPLLLGFKPVGGPPRKRYDSCQRRRRGYQSSQIASSLVGRRSWPTRSRRTSWVRA